MTKRLIALVLLNLICSNVFSQEIYYMVVNDTIPETGDMYEEDGLRGGSFVFPSFSEGFIGDINSIMCVSSYFDTAPDTTSVFTSDLEIEGSDKFSNDIISGGNSHEENKSFWIPAYYIESLENPDKEILNKYKPYIQHESIWYESTEDIYFDQLFMKISPSGSTASYLFILNIKQIGAGCYRLFVIPKISLTAKEPYILPTELLKYFKDDTPVIIYIHHDDSSLRLYIENHQDPVWDLAKINNNLKKIIENFLENGTPPMDNDWKKNIYPEDTGNNKPLLLSEIKSKLSAQPSSDDIYITNEDLDMYSVPYVSDKLKTTTVPQRTLLHFLESGSYAILEGKKAPWMHVETEDGIRGWVWGGFLKELSSTVFSSTHKVMEKLRLRESSDTSSRTITLMAAELNVQLLETGKTQTIDGITAPWVKIITENGDEGWCFGGYLADLKSGKSVASSDNKTENNASSDSDENTSDDSSVKSGSGNAALIIILIAAGAAALAVILLLIIRKKKK